MIKKIVFVSLFVSEPLQGPKELKTRPPSWKHGEAFQRVYTFFPNGLSESLDEAWPCAYPYVPLSSVSSHKNISSHNGEFCHLCQSGCLLIGRSLFVFCYSYKGVSRVKPPLLCFTKNVCSWSLRINRPCMLSFHRCTIITAAEVC